MWADIDFPNFLYLFLNMSKNCKQIGHRNYAKKISVTLLRSNNKEICLIS